jgi:4a-hydroxytetrahydrobiopterin dehydratase
MLLTPSEIEVALRSLPEWTSDGKSFRRTYTFPGFLDAVAFVNHLAGIAEAQGHHPDISVSNNRVSLSLTTHDAGGLTAKDLAFARFL